MDSKKSLLQIWSRIVAKAWADEDFKQELLEKSSEVLKENGYPVQENATYTILQDTKSDKNIILHLKNDSFEYQHPSMQKAWEKLIAAFKKDEKLKKELFLHPKKVMQQYHIPIAENINYHIFEETPSQKYFIITTPSQETLSEEHLSDMSAGVTGGFCTDSSSG